MSTSPDNDSAYHDLARVFSARRKDNSVLEIEILPPGLGPFLHDEHSIGITKKHLVKAFVTARQLFFRALNGPSNLHDDGSYDHKPKTPQSGSEIEKPRDTLLTPTEIILLFDCEHLTACNWRKRRLAALIQRHDSTDADHVRSETLTRELEAELSLMTTYLCSPLHRHTKSPTLWGHRLWVLTRLLRVRRRRLAQNTGEEEESNVELESTLEVLKNELHIVFRSGERHPRNYYAFTYIRQLREHLSGVGGDTRATTDLSRVSTFLARSILDSVLDWCLAHPSDISGWSLTLYLLESVHEEDVCTNSIDRVVRFALDVGWEGESLWTVVDLATKLVGAGELVRNQRSRPSWDMLVAPALSDTGAETGWKSWLGRARSTWAPDATAGNETCES
ncbi:hypothetical protein BO70DRAFT_312821 [Aspergillus heteromorphus CBS 117.55]|uniref:Uncharacterized protein n=1 Tax=Aspergillus heteromorphus CBS 117.55 TaxID=1448321 RepID=A0A317WMK7_9EURO|nr:uncharacterized protein BO70DRAFT_312821 [Aspergillus heteromorphus CBS 117.55]PWY86287.1 hypothetical protein BO70DRAFT_312821 [Aspergillus heteromorphus CBS 117.55]